MIPLLLFTAIVAFVVGAWGMITFKKPLHRLLMMGVWSWSFYGTMFATFEALWG